MRSAQETADAPRASVGGAALKFCGLTRGEDAATGAALGARYLGAIFAGGPRLVTPAAARAIFDRAQGTVRRVGVFAAARPEAIGEIASAVALDVVQLHADPAPETVDALRRHFGGEVWAVVRTATAELPGNLSSLFDAADAVLLDAKVGGALGGTGVALDWPALAPALARARRGRRLVLAGGLVPANVARAIAILAPDVVDVSSGVEVAPGIKDPARMAAFAAAVFGEPAEHGVP